MKVKRFLLLFLCAVMLFSMDSELFERLYLDGGEDALIQTEKIDGVETGVQRRNHKQVG